LIIFNEDLETRTQLEKYLAGIDIMRKASLQHASLPCSPLQSDVNDEEVYSVESTGATVTLSSSVALIYFYCSRLPSDWLVYYLLLIFIFHAAIYVANNLLT
jgi:endoribonuclease Dicer